MKKRTLAILFIGALLLTACGKESTTQASQATTTQSVAETETAATESTTTESVAVTETTNKKGEGEIVGRWTQTDPDEEITALTFNENTYTYDFDYSRSYEEGEQIEEDPVSGTSEPMNYFLDSECVIELEDTVLTQINMSMDDELSSYGNCGIYDEKADCIYIGESFNNLLIQFIQQGYSTQKEWLEYIEDEYYLMFVR